METKNQVADRVGGDWTSKEFKEVIEDRTIMVPVEGTKDKFFVPISEETAWDLFDFCDLIVEEPNNDEIYLSVI